MWGSVNVPGSTTQGLDGKFAYEVAAANGFSGTEAQWLASLKGIPPGSTAGQIPVKVDGTDYNTQWKTLTADDVGAVKSPRAHSDYLNKENPVVSGIINCGNGLCFDYDSYCYDFSTALGSNTTASIHGIAAGNCARTR